MMQPSPTEGRGKWRSSSEKKKTLLSRIPLHSPSPFAHQRRARRGLVVSIHASGTPIPTAVVGYTIPSRPLSTIAGLVLCDATALANARHVLLPASRPPRWSTVLPPQWPRPPRGGAQVRLRGLMAVAASQGSVTVDHWCHKEKQW